MKKYLLLLMVLMIVSCNNNAINENQTAKKQIILSSIENNETFIYDTYENPFFVYLDKSLDPVECKGKICFFSKRRDVYVSCESLNELSEQCFRCNISESPFHTDKKLEIISNYFNLNVTPVYFACKGNFEYYYDKQHNNYYDCKFVYHRKIRP